MKHKHNKIVIDGIDVLPGEHKKIMLSMPELYDCTPISMPVHVIRGKRPGPVLCVTAAVHGDEVNGIEIIRRLLKKKIYKNMAGTLIAIPIVNVYGFLYHQRYLMDRRDLNRSFPGSKMGSLAGRLAHLLSKEILLKSTHIIDLHSGSMHRSNLPQIRANIDKPEIRRLAKSFCAPVILHAAMRDGSMREFANNKSIPFLLYEAGESLRFDELSIRTGVRGILNVMHELKMIALKKHHVENITPTIARSSYWVRASNSGILHAYKGLGKRVEKGDLLAKIGNPTSTVEYELRTPIAGVIIGKSNFPTVHEGAALFHIACFAKTRLVTDQIEVLQETFNDHIYNFQGQ